MTVPLKQSAHPPHDLNWIAVWETRAAGELFAAVRAYCGLPPVVGPVPTDDEVQRELAEARAILGEIGSDDSADDSDPARQDGAARVTLEALMYSLRTRGAAALVESDTRRRLGELNDDQVIEVGTRLRNLKPRPWTADEVAILMQTYESWQ